MESMEDELKFFGAEGMDYIITELGLLDQVGAPSVLSSP